MLHLFLCYITNLRLTGKLTGTSYFQSCSYLCYHVFIMHNYLIHAQDKIIFISIYCTSIQWDISFLVTHEIEVEIMSIKTWNRMEFPQGASKYLQQIFTSRPTLLHSTIDEKLPSILFLYNTIGQVIKLS